MFFHLHLSTGLFRSYCAELQNKRFLFHFLSVRCNYAGDWHRDTKTSHNWKEYTKKESETCFSPKNLREASLSACFEYHENFRQNKPTLCSKRAGFSRWVKDGIEHKIACLVHLIFFSSYFHYKYSPLSFNRTDGLLTTEKNIFTTEKNCFYLCIYFCVVRAKFIRMLSLINK